MKSIRFLSSEAFNSYVKTLDQSVSLSRDAIFFQKNCIIWKYLYTWDSESSLFIL